MSEKRTPSIPYVLTLTIVDASTLVNGQITNDSLVLCCVRNHQVNQTHPDVVSVPTQRIPEILAKDILSTSTKIGCQDDTILWKQRFTSNKNTNGHNSIIYCVESLLSRKLGITAELEKDEIEFEAAVVGTHTGVAKYENLSSEEQLQMVNVLAQITKGAEKFPSSTASFDISNWIRAEGFMRMWDDGKDVTLAGVHFEKAMGICVDGLCILSTYDVLSSRITHV